MSHGNDEKPFVPKGFSTSALQIGHSINLLLNSFCFNCNVFMCEECLSAHHVITRNSGHRTVPLGRLKLKDYEDVLRRSTFCAHKFNERGIVEYFCYNCDACVCHVCNVAIQHKHRIIDIDVAANEQKMKLREVNARLKTKLQSVEHGISNIEFRSVEVQEQIDYTKNDIRSKIANMIDILKKHQEDMLQEVERIRKDKQENLTFQLRMYETMRKQTKGSIQFTEELIHRNLSEEILTIKNYVFERARAIDATYVGTNPAENERVGYVANTKVFDAIQQEALGHISTSLTEPAVSNAEGNGISDVSAGEEVYFMVTTRNAQGDTYYSEIDHVVVGVKSDMWGDIDASVKNYQDGRYEVSYIPRVPGIHKIQVEVSGEHIEGSPFVVHVKQPVLTPVKSFGSHGKNTGNFLQPHGVAGTEDGKFMHPMSIAFDKSEHYIFATDSDNNRIQVFDIKSGRFVRKFGTEGNGPGQFNGPCGVSVDGTDRVIVTDWNNNRIQVFNNEGKFLFKFGDKGSERLVHPRCAVYHESDNSFIVSDTGNNILKVFDQDGKFSHVIGKPGRKRVRFDSKFLDLDLVAALTVDTEGDAEDGIVKEASVDASIQSSPVQSSPVQSSPVQSSPVQSSPVQSSPVQSSSSPVQSSPVQSSPVQSSPVQSSPVQSSPVQSSPVQSSPVQSSPVQSSPVQSSPVQSSPVQSSPVQSSPVQSSPVQYQSSPVQSSPVQSSPVQSSPVQSSPVQSSPVQSSPVQSSPVQSSPVQSSPVQFQSSPVQSSPVQSSPVQSSPVQSSPVQSSPVQSSPVQSSPVQSSPVQSSPVQSSPVSQSSPVQSSPVQSSPVQSSPVQSSPVQSSPVQSSPVQSSPVQSSPVQSSPVQSSPVFQSSPVQSSPVQSSPVQSSPVQSSPVQSSPVQSSPVQSSPVQSSPVQSSPVQSSPVQSQSSPVQSSPVQSSPVQSSPVQSSPVQSSPVQSSPVQSSPVQSSPVQSSPVQSSPVQSSPVQSSPVQSLYNMLRGFTICSEGLQYAPRVYWCGLPVAAQNNMRSSP
ncbi:hypothetical protein QZH41_006541 [Actinostola sp. cb2023]|nr:hypothetical protein QZH41_006541 [Actinostola sp. cb2023]